MKEKYSRLLAAPGGARRGIDHLKSPCPNQENGAAWSRALRMAETRIWAARVPANRGKRPIPVVTRDPEIEGSRSSSAIG